MTARAGQAEHLATLGAAGGAGEFLDQRFLCSNAPSPGFLDLTLRVGGIAIRLTGLSARQKEALQARYGIFCRREEDPRATAIHVSRAGRSGFLRAARESEYYRLETEWEGETLLACSYEWAGWLDLNGSCGGLSLADVAESDPKAFDRSIENFLRVIYAHLLIPGGGFLLHSAGLVRHGRAYLFFGPSGSGKTTVTMLSPEALVLSDDLTMVLRSAEGDPLAGSVPFRGLFAPQPASEKFYPVAGFFRLVQDGVDRLEQVSGARAVGELVGSLPFVTQRPDIAGDVIDTVAAATARTPVYRLHFRKDRTFWRAIEAIGPKVDDFPAAGGIKS